MFILENENGFSVVELLISLFISSILLVGVLTIYLSLKKNLQLRESLAEIQNRGQFLSYLLTKRIRMAGYSGCENSSLQANQQNALRGYDEQNMPLSLRAKVKLQSDVIVIGQCVHYLGSERFLKTIYYISDTHRKNLSGEPIFSLYIKILSSRAEEIAQNIGNIKIRYGIGDATMRNILVYLPASQVQDWLKVKAIRITLTLLDSSHKLKRNWPLYIALRNRIDDE